MQRKKNPKYHTAAEKDEEKRASQKINFKTEYENREINEMRTNPTNHTVTQRKE